MFNIIGKQKRSVDNLGGKGFNLIKLDRLNLTPSFFIISCSVFYEYVKGDNELTNYLKNNSENIDRKYVRRRILNFKIEKKFKEEIEKSIKQLNIDKLIIRSSFIGEDSSKQSFAGLFESYLCKNKKDIFAYIKKVWACQFSEKVLSYNSGETGSLGMAVIIQDFIKPNFSGVVFSQNFNKELLIEYCKKSYCATQLGSIIPNVYCRRNDNSFMSSLDSRGHIIWIEELIRAVEPLLKQKSLDIEFAIKNDKIYLLQIRPLTKKIDVSSLYFIFDRHNRWNYDVEDFSLKKFKNIIKDIGIDIEIDVKKTDKTVFMKADSYFLLFKKISLRAQNLNFLNDFFKFYVSFVMEENKKLKSAKNGIVCIKNVKQLNFKISIIDFVHRLVLKGLKEFLGENYNINEKDHFELFAPPVSFSTQALLLHRRNDEKLPKLYDSEALENIDAKEYAKLLENVKVNRENVVDSLNNTSGKKRSYLLVLKKHIWLCDFADYYYDVFGSFYGERVYRFLNKKNIKHPFDDCLKICKFSMEKIRNGEFKKIKRYQKIDKKQETLKFPLSGVIASSGNFSGRVRLIKNMLDIRKVTKKDILVSKNTRPSLVVGMAVARGIITEEGGLTSHAAIVSRELNKPCVIATQGCMRLLRNGDKIKVVNGKVYKLS